MSIKLFDVNYYRQANPDLARAGLNTDAQLVSHFQNSGLNEGRGFSSLVELKFYRSSNSDLAQFNNRQLFEHLQNNGVLEGRRFSPIVDLQVYKQVNGDLVAANLNNEQLFEHLRDSGLREKRTFSEFVDINFYLNNNPDLVQAGLTGVQLLDHFQIYGIDEKRSFSPIFNATYYSSLNPDLVAANLTSGKQLFEHFLSNGLNEGRIASPEFNVQAYLAANPDLRAAGFSLRQAFQHFVVYGQRELRFSGSDFAGNSLNQARNFNITENNTIFRDFVGSSDINDYYQFSINALKTINLKLDDLTANTDVELLGQAGNVIKNSIKTGTDAESFSISLEAGTYSIRVFRVGENSNTNYNLTVSAASINLPNNVSATDITSSPYLDANTVSLGADKFYYFNISTDRKVTGQINGLSANADLQLIRDANNNGTLDNGEIIGTSENTDTTQEEITRILAAGNYYIRVLANSSTANFNLNLSSSGVQSQVLYNGASGGTPNTQNPKWLDFASATYTPGSLPSLGTGGTQTAGNNGTTLTTNTNGYAGYSNYQPPTLAQILAGQAPNLANPAFPTLNANSGYSIRFRIKVNSETNSSDDNQDGLNDRAGFSVITLDSNKKGIELGFWTNEIWGQTSSPLFTHSQTERAFLDTQIARNYEISVLGTSYQLFADNSLILSGQTKDYSAFNHTAAGLPYDPYELQNFLFFGDDTTSAQASITLESISVITPTVNYSNFLA